MSFLNMIILYQTKFILLRYFLILFLILQILSENNQNKRNLEFLLRYQLKYKVMILKEYFTQIIIVNYLLDQGHIQIFF